jgi:hypothetical protein
MQEVDFNSRTTVLNEVTHINFPALTVLNVGGNKMESIEGLAHVYMPHIQILSLRADGC